MSKEQNHDETPLNQSDTCLSCKLAATDDCVRCVKCGKKIHLSCLAPGIRREDFPWECNQCKSSLDKNPPPKAGSVKSRRSKASTSQQTALKRIEEERRLKEELLNTKLMELEKIHRAYIEQKYAIEEDVSSDSGSVVPEDNNKEQVEDWLNNVSTIPKLVDNSKDLAVNIRSSTITHPIHDHKDKPEHVKLVKAVEQKNNPQLMAHELDQQNFSQSFQPLAELSSGHIAARHSSIKNLPSFSGNVEDWPAFINAYNVSTSVCGFSLYENLIRLNQSLSGQAKDVVKGLLILPATVPRAIETLEMLFGRPEKIISNLMENARSMKEIESNDLQAYVDLSNSVDNLCATMEATNMNTYLNNPSLIDELVGKLPGETKLSWGIYCDEVSEINLKHFSDWLRKRAYAAIRVTSSQGTSKKPNRKHGKYVNIHDAVLPNTNSSARKCPKCNGECIRVRECQEFKNADAVERLAIVQEHNLCFTCLGSHKQRCLSKKLCGVNGCKERHHPLLHQEDSDRMYLHKSTTNTRNILFRIVPITLYGNRTNISCLALLDEGSSVTLLDQEVADKLNVKGTNQPICMKWSDGNVKAIKDSKLFSIGISSIISQVKLPLNDVHSVPNLDLPLQGLMKDYIEKYDHLKNIPISTYEAAKPKLLIGLNNSHLGTMRKFREGLTTEPIASYTKLGWIVHGCSGKSKEDLHSFNLHICDCDVHKMVKNYFAIDSMGILKNDDYLPSIDDQKALEIMKQNTRRLEDRFTTGLLWRNPNCRLPDSYSMAERRLFCFERKLSKDPVLYENVRQQIQDYKSKGYIRQLSKDESNHRHHRTWYLPLFVVSNHNKPKRTRLIWDAAAKVNGASLNSFLYSGPDQTSSLIGVLFRFRQEKIAVTADIKEMFHQVVVNDEDKDSQRFLYRNSPDEPIQHFVMNVMTFGATCSPSLAQFIKNQNALEYKDCFPESVTSIVKNHYVDDYLDSLPTKDEAIKRCQEIKLIHHKAGFHIHKWKSNCKEILKLLDENNEELSDICISNEDETHKILGLWWNSSRDTFEFKLTKDSIEDPLLSGKTNPTKRDLLSVLMKVFDPIGFLTNYLVFLKVLLQEVWKSSTGWDDELMPTHLDQWNRWRTSIIKITSIQIPRWYNFSASSEDTELHVFVDASQCVFATVAYFRKSLTGSISTAFVGSKSRVAPIKLISIPRLELQSAVLGVRIAKTISDEHNVHISRRIFWTDSNTVLSWINMKQTTLKQYVAFRVGEILEYTNCNEWRYIPSAENVADEATKWPRNVIPQNDRWLKGPQFLQLEEHYWPTLKPQPSPHVEEEIKSVLLHDLQIMVNLVDPLRFSNWIRMVRTVARVVRAIDHFKNQKHHSNLLQSEELRNAENLLFKQSQSESFSEEVNELHNLHSKSGVSKRSSIYKLCPYLDEFGVMRMRSRIELSTDVSVEVKRPVILCRKNEITKLLVMMYHSKYHHEYDDTVINEIRQRFIISNVKALLKSLKKSCCACKIRKSGPVAPLMSDLPPARLTIATEAFTYVGLDLFGPITICVGRKTEKRWVKLSTCLVVRAIHMEILKKLDIDSCVMGIKRFIARRGTPREFYSDNGTNFRGSSAEIRELWKKSGEDIAAPFITSETKWIFNPPASPHMGGSWERLIRSVKTTLSKTLPSKNPTEEVLYTMLAEVESIVNSRPLTNITLENETEESLTPNHFLLKSSSGYKALGPCLDDRQSLKRSWLSIEHFARSARRRWILEYLPVLAKRSKWCEEKKPIEDGDLVLIFDENSERPYTRGRVIKAIMGKNNQVRSAIVKTINGIYTRPATKLAVLDVRRRNEQDSRAASPGGVLANTKNSLALTSI